MATVATPIVKRRDWRSIVFIALTGLLAVLVVVTALPSVLDPWLHTEAVEPGFTPELHRWHAAQWGALKGILVSGSLLVLLWRPRAKPVLVQFVALSVGVLALLTVPLAPGTLVFLWPFLLVIATYPAPRALLDVSRQEPLSRPLLALTLLAALLLAPYAWRSLLWQLGGVGGEHAALFHWIESVVISIVLVLAGVLAAMKRPGWQALGIIVGLAFIYLGAVALQVPYHDGSWGIAGGLLATLGGCGFIATTVWEARNMRHVHNQA